MASTNSEFMPHKPRDEPMQTSGHQVGRQVGNDAAPEFHAQTLPAGSAPPESTFKPNPIDETPGQADNELAGRSHGKENTSTSASDTLGGATSADVHTGYGHPGSGQTTAETKGNTAGSTTQAEGGSGLTGEENAEARSLQKDHEGGPSNVREHNVSLDGAESKIPESS